jgi:chromosome segregation ATPase
MGVTHSFDSNNWCDCSGQRKEGNLRETLHTRPWSQEHEPNELEKQHTSLKRAAPAIEKIHRHELTKAIAQHEQDLEAIHGISLEMKELEQRIKIVERKLHELDKSATKASNPINDTTGQKEHHGLTVDLSTLEKKLHELTVELSKLQNHKKKLAHHRDHYMRKMEDDLDKVKELRKLVAEERDNGFATFVTLRDHAGTSTDPGRMRSTSPRAVARNASPRLGTSPDPSYRPDR